MVWTCEIEFDNNPFGTYFAGQLLAGKVILRTDKVKLVKAISLNINGFSETRWTENHTVNKKRKRRTYYGREDFIASKIYLLGPNASTGQISMEAGTHTYNFCCQIPPICPSSFEGTHGRVRYMVNVVLERSAMKLNQTYTRCFTVLTVMDLNLDSPMLKMPVQAETQKSYCCWPCRSQPLGLQLSMPQTGFVPGQNIPLGIVVTNDSHIQVEELQMTLAMIVSYATLQPAVHTRDERFVVSRLMGDAVMRNCKKQFSYELHVPATPPTCIYLSRIIKIAYQIELVAKVKGCHTNGTLTIPVTIGTVPLTQQFQVPSAAAVEVNSNAQPLNVMALGESVGALKPVANTDSNRPWAVDETIPPPNYEEAVHMRSVDTSNFEEEADIRDPPNTLSLNATRSSSFTPLYPVFHIPSPTAPPEWDHLEYGMNNGDTNLNKGTWL